MTQHPGLLAGPLGFDDVGALRHEDGRVTLHTVDFFPPMVDDPKSYGAVAAANALSDIYASGAKPSVVLNLAGFPEDWDDGTLAAVFAGAMEKVQESGALWIGGHTVKSAEPLFGFAVFGELSSQEQLCTNSDAKVGDRLFLTKPLGTGVIVTSICKGTAEDSSVAAAIQSMIHLNADVLPAFQAGQVKAATDITGFGLCGHAANLARASAVTLAIESNALPLISGASDLAQTGVFSGAVSRGRENLNDCVSVAGNVPEWLSSICFDAETSGGILACVPSDHAQDFCAAFPSDNQPILVGKVEEGAGRVELR